MSVFKYLILTEARLKYNSGEALLLSLLKGTRAHGDRERERERETGEKEREKEGETSPPLCNVRRSDVGRQREMEGRAKRGYLG